MFFIAVAEIQNLFNIIFFPQAEIKAEVIPNSLCVKKVDTCTKTPAQEKQIRDATEQGELSSRAMQTSANGSHLKQPSKRHQNAF